MRLTRDGTIQRVAAGKAAKLWLHRGLSTAWATLFYLLLGRGNLQKNAKRAAQLWRRQSQSAAVRTWLEWLEDALRTQDAGRIACRMLAHRGEKQALNKWRWVRDDQKDRTAAARVAYIALHGSSLRANWGMLRLYTEAVGVERRKQQVAFARVKQLWTMPYFRGVVTLTLPM